MNDQPRQILREIVEKYGPGIVSDPRRCRALLFDYSSQYRREIFVLVSAQEEEVARDLRDNQQRMPLSVLVAQLTQRLMDNRALAHDAALWAVTAWAEALGLDLTGVTLPAAPSAKPTDAPPTPAPVPDAPSSPTPPPHSQAVFVSNHIVEVYGRAREGADNGWERLGVTPGAVDIPPGFTLGLRPVGVEGDALARWIGGVAYPEQITSLDINDRVNDAGLKSLPALKQLSYLALNNGADITDAGMDYLRQLPLLTTLKLAWVSRVTAEGIAQLRDLTGLTHLSLAWANVTDGSLRHLSALTRLKSLELRECKKLAGTGLVHLTPLHALRTLELTGGSEISDEGLRAIGGLTGLTKLDLSRCPRLTMWGMEHLPALAQLAYLDLSWNTGIGDVGLVPLQSLAKLSTLNLARTNLTDEGLKYLRQNRTLIYLDLSWCDRLTDRGIANLRELTNLAYLNLTGCKRLTARGINRLERQGLYITGRG